MKMTSLAGDIGGTKTILRLASAEVSDTGNAMLFQVGPIGAAVTAVM